MFHPPLPTPYDVSFRFFGFPVRIHPLFWVVAVLLGISGDIGDMRSWFLDLAIWIAAVFVAILVHELGHSLVFRHVFRVRSMIVLHGAGGLAIPLSHHYRKPRLLGFFSEVLLSASGVLAGFLLLLFVYLFFRLIGVEVYVSGITLDPFSNPPDVSLPMIVPVLKNSYLLRFFIDLSFICVFWGVFNLLPVYPLDGGHIAREVFCLINPRTGVANSLTLSIVVAVGIAVLWIRMGEIYPAALFAYLAYLSWQALVRREA